MFIFLHERQLVTNKYYHVPNSWIKININGKESWFSAVNFYLIIHTTDYFNINENNSNDISIGKHASIKTPKGYNFLLTEQNNWSTTWKRKFCVLDKILILKKKTF